MNRRHALWVLAIASLACGDGFGRAVVGSKAPPAVQNAQCFLDPEPCGADPVPSVLEASVQPVDFRGCARVPECSLELTPSGAERPTPDCGSEPELLLGDAPLPGLLLHCARRTLRVAPSATLISIPGLDVASAELRFASDHPVTIDLPGAQLDTVNIEIDGPITLRFVADSVLLKANLVQTGTTSAAVELIDSRATALQVTGTSGSFRGSLHLQRVWLFAGMLIGDSVKLEASSAEELRVKALDLIVIDLRGRNLTFEPRSGLISYVKATNVELHGCGSLLLADSTLEDSTLRACEGGLRLYGTTIRSTSISGPVEAVGATFLRAVIGAQADTSLEFWGGSTTGSTVCEHTRSFAIATKAVLCTTCVAQVQQMPEVICATAAGQGLPREFNPGCELVETALPCDPSVENERPAGSVL